MAPKKGKGKGRKYGYRRRRAGYVNRSGGLVRALKTTAVPDRLLVRFQYKDNINLSSSASAWAISDFRLNSIYDPDCAQLNGHQPLGHDQWAVFYNQYRVYKTSISVTFINNQNGAIQCGIIPWNDAQTLQYDDSTFEQPHAISKTMAGSQGMNKVTLTRTYHMPRLLGQSSTQYKSNSNLQAAFGANPLEQIFARIAVRSVNESAQPSVVAVVNIVYHVELFDREIMKISVPEGKSSAGAWDVSGNPSYLPPPEPSGPTGPYGT